MRLLTVVMAGLLVSVSGQQCQSALQAVSNLTNSQTAANLVYQSPTSSTGGVCTSRSTCCSPAAEQLLRTDSLTRYQSLLSSKLRATITPCIDNSSVAAESAAYVVDWKDTVIDFLNAGYSQFNIPTLLDPFSNYMTNGILSLSLPDFQVELQSLFFEIYLRTFKLSIETTPGNAVPNTVSFRQCFYQHLFFPDNIDRLNQRYRILQPRLNLLLRYLLALKTSDSVLESIMNHVLSPECGDALLRLTHCRECSGTTSSSPPCTPFCQNVLRGCLVDLTEVGHVLQEFATQLEAMKEKLRNDNPFSAIDLLISTVFDVVNSGRNVAARKETIETTCNVRFSSSKRRRSVTSTKSFHHIRRRQQSNTPNPLGAIERSATCVKNLAQAIRSLPEQLCTAAGSSTSACWNGMTVGSYSKALVPPDRLSQVNNSELLKIYPDTGLQYRDAIAQLKNMTAQLTSCSGTLDCSVKLVSLSVPSPSDCKLTGPRYANISRPIVTPVPVSSTIFNPSTTQHLSSTVATSHHFFESSTVSPTSTSHLIITSTIGHMVEPSISGTTSTISSSIAESSITTAVTTSNNIPQPSLDAATPSIAPSHSSMSSAVTESVSSTDSLSVPVSSSSLAPQIVPSSTHLPAAISASSTESASLTTQVKSEAPPLCTSAAQDSSFNIAPTSQPSTGTVVSGVMIGVFGAGWALLLLSLFVNFILLVVVMKDKKRRPATDKICNTSVQANGISATAVYANGTGKAFADIPAAYHNIEEPDIAKSPLPKKPAPRVLYQPRYSSNPVTTV